MSTHTLGANSAAAVGVLSAAPFLILNAMVGSGFEPLLSVLRPGGHAGPGEPALLVVVALILPLIGAYFAIRPIVRRSPDGKRRMYLLNAVIASVLVIASVTITTAVGAEMYQCDILKIPNCD